MESSVDAYISSIPEDKRDAFLKLREAILLNLPKGFEETISYNMLGYVVPLSLYPEGYHCNEKQPLPFINIAAQKNFLAMYHMGLYTDPNLFAWFTSEFGRQSTSKLDMGKSCIRFKKLDQIPYALIGELATKLSPKDWIIQYEQSIKK